MSGVLPGFAGDLGRVTLWPIAMSASRAKASYRQQNDMAQWVGISGENASSDTNKAPAAVPVQETLTGGVAKTIDVIARAYDPDGDALSIQSGSLSPTTGAASIVSDQISWTPATSFSGAAECSFTLRDGGGKTSQSKVYARVTAGTEPPPPTDFPEAPFTPTSIVEVANAGEFDNKYRNVVQAGQWLRLAPGTYLPNNGYQFNRTFAAPGIAIVGRDISNGHTPTTIIATNEHDVTAPYHWFHQIQFTHSITDLTSKQLNEGMPMVMRITAGNVSYTKCWFRGNRGLHFHKVQACQNNYVGWNRFSTIVAQGNTHIKIQLDDFSAGQTYHKNMKIARNYFRNIGPTDDNNAFAIYLGNGHAHGSNKARYIDGFRLTENLFQSPASGWDKAVYLKCGVEEVMGNTIDGNQAFIMRHGSLKYCTPASENTVTTISTARFWRNWLKVTTLELGGAGHDLRGNYVECSTGIGVKPGYNRSSGQVYDAAHDSVFVGNDIRASGGRAYRLGLNETGATLADARGGKLRGIKVYNTLGNAIPSNIAAMVNDAAFCDTSGYVLQTGLGPYADPGMAVKLAQTDVGFKVTGQDGG